MNSQTAYPTLTEAAPDATVAERTAAAAPESQQPPVRFPTLLARMTRDERIDSYRHGAFTRRERSIWACRYPEETPLVNGELEWLVVNLTDLD